jgi:hypothetical protein
MGLIANVKPGDKYSSSGKMKGKNPYNVQGPTVSGSLPKIDMNFLKEYDLFS